MTAANLDSPSVTANAFSIIPDARQGQNVIPDARQRDPGSRRSHKRLALFFIHNDHLGTPHKVTDGEQRTVWYLEQTPFGEVSLATEAIRMPTRFPGQYSDIKSGFNYNYFRDYDPSMGRYIQSDPIGSLGGQNQYLYSTANPTIRIDRSGLWSIIVGAEVTSAIQLGLGVVFTEGGEDHPDAGVWGSAGAALGPEVGATAFFTFLVGGRENFEGRTDSVNFSWGFEFELHKNVQTGEWVGFTLGAGAGGGASLSAASSAAATIGDGIDQVRRLIDSLARALDGVAEVSTTEYFAEETEECP
ncbi:MAG: RHS domain-containing protein [Pseudomonadales bacterium]|nr:RHS domain-containing protein [Pseudomonadales bacterium]